MVLYISTKQKFTEKKFMFLSSLAFDYFLVDKLIVTF